MASTDKVAHQPIGCEVCEESEDETATSYCCDCGQYMCPSCLKLHQRVSSTKGHTILRGDDLPMFSKENALISAIVSFCRNHGNRLFEYFCLTHDVPCCSQGLYEDHRQCNDVQKLSEVSSRVKESSLCQTTTERVSQLLQEFIVLRSDRIQELTSLEEQIQGIGRDVDDVKTGLGRLKEQLETESQHKLEAIENTDKRSVKRQVETCDAYIRILQQQQGALKSTLQDASEEKTFMALKSKEKFCAEYQVLLKNLQDESKHIRLDFQVPESIRNLLSLQSFGKINCIEESSFLHQERRSSDSVEEVEMEFIQPCPEFLRKASDSDTSGPYEGESSTVLAVGTYLVKTVTDRETCCITGMAKLEDDSFLLTDFNNDKLKLFNGEFHLKSETPLQTAPWDVTAVSLTLSAVTLPYQKLIQFVRYAAGRGLTLGKTINTRGRCRGVVFTNGKLVVSSQLPGQVEIMDLKGNLLQRIDTDPLTGQKTLFSSPFYLTVNKEGTLIFVSDYHKSCVLGVTLKGHVQFVCEGFRGPGGVSVDTEGNVYVAEVNAHKVSVISAEGKNVKDVILEGSVRFPRDVIFCSNTDLLIIGMWSDRVKLSKVG